MERVTLDQAKDRLDELAQRAASGEEIIIADPSSGDLRLQPLQAVSRGKPKRIPGRWKGRIHIPDDKLLEPRTEEELS